MEKQADSWAYTKLSALFVDPRNQIVDGPFGSNLKASEYKDLGIPILRIQNIGRNRFIQKNIKFISKQKAEQLKRHTYKRGDIVLTKLGDPLGEACIIPDTFPDGVIVADLVRLRLDNEYISEKFLMHCINAPFVITQLKEMTKGTTRPRVNLTLVREINLLLPSLPEQEQLVSIIEELLSDLDNAIENFKKVQVQLKVYRQAVLKCAFEGQFTKEWRHSNLYPIEYLKTFMARIDELNSMKDGGDLPRRLPPINLKDLYVLPENWVWLEAHKVCQSVRDGTHDTPKYVDNGIPLVTSKNLKEGKIDFRSVDFISDEDHKKIQDRSGVDLGDILFGMIGTIGNPVVITDKRQFSIKNVGLFKMNQGLVISGYLKYWLDSSLMMHILQEKDLIRGTTQKFIALGGLRVLPVPVPSVNEQSAILNEIESRFSVCNKLEETVESSLRQAESLRQSILKQAFEGELTEQWRKKHKDLISGENSAEALLKMIKAEKETFHVKPKGKKKHD